MNRSAIVSPGPDSVPRRALHVRIRNTQGKLLIAVGNESFQLSETAAFIWESIDGTNTIADISRGMAAEYEVDSATALADVRELISTLAQANLVSC